MAMEDMWNLRTSLNRPPGQPSPGPSTLNQFGVDPGQLSQPYVAQEVCVIERTISQERVTPNLMNFGSQGLTPNELRSELLALVSGIQQPPHGQSYLPSMNSRSSFMASYPQFSHMNATDSAGLSGWPSMSPPNVLQTNRLNWIGSANAGADAQQPGRGRDSSVVINGRVHENFSSNGLRTPVSASLKQSLGVFSGTQDHGVDVNRQSPSPQWLTENRRQKHHAQGAQTTTLLSAKPESHRTETIPSNIGSGLPGRPHSRPRPACSGRLRVFCPNYTTGTSLGGELCLTDSGRLGIICNCHSVHLSVSKFTQHAGMHNVNAGEAVFMEDGETLVRWRKAFFSQYGVKVPDDNVGWDWLDADSMETGPDKYKTVMTQSWQKEVNVSYGGNTPMVKSRTTQVWDASLANGINPTLHATQSISNTKFAPLNTGHGGIPISRDSLLRNFGMDCKGGTLTPDSGSTHIYADTLRQNFSRSPGNTVSSASLQGTSCLGVMPLSNEFNFINDGLHRFLSPSQQRASATKNLDEPNHPSNRWGIGQEPRLKENDTSASNFELRLGQPSQQSQPAGPSFSSMPALRIEHPKSNLLEHMMSKVWDGRLQHDPQQFNLAELPRFSGIPGQAREQAVATTSGRTDYERTSYMETPRMNGQNAEQDRNCSNLVQSQSTRLTSNLLQTASKPSIAEKSEAKVPSLDRGPQANELSAIGAWQFQTGQTDQSLLDKFVPHTDHSKRSVSLENGTALDSIISGTSLRPSDKAEQSRLETAIKSSLGYQAAGLESLSVKENDGLTKRVLGVNLPGDLAGYRRPPYPLEGSVPSFTVGNDHSGPMFDPNRVLHRDSVGRPQHLPNGATYMQEHQGGLLNHLLVAKSAIAESSHMHDEFKSRRLAQPSSEELQDSPRSISEKHRQIHDPQLVANKKQSWSQNAPDLDTIVDSRMGFKVRDSEDQSSELLGGQNHHANGAGHAGICRRPLPDLVNGDPKSGPEQDKPTQDVPDLSTKDREDIHCPCYRCRKASPSTTGRAVPRLAGQVCLKDIEGQGSKMEPSKKSTRGDTVLNSSKDSPHFNEELKSNEPSPDINPDIIVKSENSTGNLGGQLLPLEGAEEMCEQQDEKLEASVQSDPLITGKEDLLSDTAAKGISIVTDSPHIAKAVSDICSKSSENILSGISDGGCDNNGGEEALHVQSIPKIPEAGALDEDSGIGKCCSSDGVDMGVAPNLNPVSALEDPSKQNSPSSLGGPSSSSAGNRLIMKKCGIRSAGGWQVSKEPAQDDLCQEAVPSAGKMEKKRRRTLKWTQLDSDDGAGEPKQGSLVTISGHTHGPVTSVDKSEVGTQMRKSEARSDQGVEDTGISAKTSEETVPLSKRRKSVVASERSSAPEANTPECTENRTTVGEDGEQRKVRTLVIRVPQGVNRQKAKRANCTDSSPNTRVAESKLDLSEEACLPKSGATKGPICGDSPSTEGAPVNRKSSSSDVANTVLARSEEVPSFLTKSLRSARTPRGGPSPRSGRMMSLSAILKQPKESRIDSNNKAGHKQVQKLNTDASTSNLQGKIHKKLDASVAFVATPTKVTDFSLPEMESPRREERKTKVLSKEDAQKVRRLGELTGKTKMHGPGTEVFDFAEEGTEILRADKQGTATVQTADSTLKDSTVKTCFPIPKSGRSARSFPNKRNVEWHRSKDAQADPSKSGNEAVVAEKVIPQKKRTGLSYSMQPPSGSTCIPRVDPHPNSVPQVSLVRKKVRSSTVKRPQTVPRHFETEGRDLNGRVENRDSAANTKAARHVQSRPIFVASTALKRLPDHLDKFESSSKRPKMMGGSKKTSCSGEHHSNNEFAIQRVVHDPPLGKFTIYKKGKLPLCEEENISVRKQKKVTGDSDINNIGLAESSKCDVCGTSTSVTFNKLLPCSRCPVKVHQACYGVSKIPKGPWSCRTCKFRVVNPVCVLCGYSGGAMTRVRKARGFGHGLLQAWQDLDKHRVVLSEFPPDEDNETLLSATISIQSSKNCLSACIKEKHSKDKLSTANNLEMCICDRSKVDGSCCKTCVKENPKTWSSADFLHEKGLQEDWKSNNTVTALLKDSGAKQWAHIVCSLWLPGTRCLNVGTMGVFDVSSVAISCRKSLCTICLRKGGACIQCRVPQCSAAFHVWCAHEKGLLQSETIQDGTNQVGFFGKCLLHASFSGLELEAIMNKISRAATSLQTCARTEGYKGRQTLEERAKSQLQMTLEGSTAVTPQQVATWLRINDRKSSTRRFIKPANSVMKYDHREYLRFKQKKGWRRLAVYKSGIHALGLYTMEFIAEGEVVVEYIGEIIGLRVADKREAEYHSGKRLQHQGACYLFRIDTERIIDATRKGGIARYVNHSCSPNCVAKVICVDNLKKVIFFAKRDIYAGEEVTYDYKFNYDEVGDKIPCFCGCADCRGTLN